MKKVWILYRMPTKEILVPSTDYYAKPGDSRNSHQDDLTHLNEYEVDNIEVFESFTKAKQKMLQVLKMKKTEINARIIDVKSWTKRNYLHK